MGIKKIRTSLEHEFSDSCVASRRHNAQVAHVSDSVTCINCTDLMGTNEAGGIQKTLSDFLLKIPLFASMIGKRYSGAEAA